MSEDDKNQKSDLITSLDLSDINISPEGAAGLAAGLKGNTTPPTPPNLTSLNLSNANIGPEGAAALAAHLEEDATPAKKPGQKDLDAGASGSAEKMASRVKRATRKLE